MKDFKLENKLGPSKIYQCSTPLRSAKLGSCKYDFESITPGSVGVFPCDATEVRRVRSALGAYAARTGTKWKTTYRPDGLHVQRTA